MTGIHLGYAVGSAEPVAVPIAHTAVTGMTQASGKTTTLEAMVSRLPEVHRALAFVTKRGESAFAEGRRIQPYFRDRADWQFVDQLLSATLQEKNKFLRSWIIKLCRDTKTLADVLRAVRREKRKAKGISEGVYTQLEAYLELIVPEIERADLASALHLRPGLNVMDVADFATPMQMLFVQSAIDLINDHERHTIVIVPEAWEFVPEGKGSPVKASAVALVRKGAAIGNHIWVDSQDMAGVDKVILRGCTVWLIGVQREANEIKRNLANIPKGISKPSAGDVAMLERGQFYACWGRHAVKTYVQPAWMEGRAARETATGFRRLEARPAPKEITVTEQEARELREENMRLRSRVEDLERKLFYRPGGALPPDPDADLVPPPPTTTRPSSSNGGVPDIDELYAEIKRRLTAEAPAILRVLAERPELRVEVERPVIEAKGDSLRGRIAQLLVDGFYDRGATAPGTQKELGRRGYDPGPANTYKELDTLAVLGFLTIEQGKDDRSRPRKEYHAVPGMKVNIVER